MPLSRAIAGVASMAALIGAAERAWSFHFSIIKSQSRLAHLWKWSSGRPIKGTFLHGVSTLCDVDP
jgi:hypothetical protein